MTDDINIEHTRRLFETTLTKIAEKEDVRYMETLLDRYDDGSYKRYWVVNAWLGWTMAFKCLDAMDVIRREKSNEISKQIRLR